MHLVALKPMTSPSTWLLQREVVPFELDLVGQRMCYLWKRELFVKDCTFNLIRESFKSSLKPTPAFDLIHLCCLELERNLIELVILIFYQHPYIQM